MTALIYVLAFAAAPAAAWAQGLADPTRPPNASAVAGATEISSLGPQLQSVLISPGRKLAVINGETVALGGKFGQATLVRITESQVVLKSGEETQVLKLYPGVEKTTVARPRGRAQGDKK